MYRKRIKRVNALNRLIKEMEVFYPPGDNYIPTREDDVKIIIIE